MNSVYLDTSVVVDRWVGPRSTRKAIAQALEGKVVYTGSTVFREFQRVAIEPYRLVSDAIWEIPTSAAAGDRLQDLIVSLSERRWGVGRLEGRVLRVCGALLLQWDACKVVTAEMLCGWLDSQIALLRDSQFFAIGWGENQYDLRVNGTYVDPTDCEVARVPLDPKVIGTRRISCNKATRSCSAADLLADNRSQIEVFVDLGRRTTATTAARRSLAPPKGRPASSLGQRMCWPLGDLFVGLECPDHAVIWSRDSDFDAVCRATDTTWVRLEDQI